MPIIILSHPCSMKRLFPSLLIVQLINTFWIFARSSRLRVAFEWWCEETRHVEKKRWHKASYLWSTWCIPDGYSMQRTETRDVCMLLPDMRLNPLSWQSRWNVSDALITHKCQSVWFLESGQRAVTRSFALQPLPLFRKSIILPSRRSRLRPAKYAPCRRDAR